MEAHDNLLLKHAQVSEFYSTFQQVTKSVSEFNYINFYQEVFIIYVRGELEPACRKLHTVHVRFFYNGTL